MGVRAGTPRWPSAPKPIRDPKTLYFSLLYYILLHSITFLGCASCPSSRFQRAGSMTSLNTIPCVALSQRTHLLPLLRTPRFLAPKTQLLSLFWPPRLLVTKTQLLSLFWPPLPSVVGPFAPRSQKNSALITVLARTPQCCWALRTSVTKKLSSYHCFGPHSPVLL